MSNKGATGTMKNATVEETKLIDKKHEFRISGTQFGNIRTEPVPSVGLLLGKFYLKREKSCPPEIQSNCVTNYKNSVKSVPYMFRVTGKCTVRNKIREFPTSSFILWFCLLLVLIITNASIIEVLKKKNQSRDMAVMTLETVVTQLEKRTQDLENSLVALRLHYSSSLINAQKLPSGTAASDTLIRWKRANTEAPCDSKDRKKNRRNWTRSKETVAVQFSGSKPYGFTMVPSEGILGPWIESTNNFSNIEKFGARLSDHNSTLEINKDGVYMVYAQVTYQSINVSNSYSINVIANTDKRHSQPITTCSSFGKIVTDGEISCYTSVVKRLNVGDVMYIQQAQPNREIIFSKAYTYFGLVFLMA